MATLYPENQQYVPKEGQSSSKAILPGLMKKLQEDVRKTTANQIRESISSDFIPQYGTEPNVGKPVLDRFKQGEFGFETGTQISPSSERYEPLPSYGQYVPADTKDINVPRWISPSEQAKVSNLPGGMGSYTIDPSQQGKLIKSERVLLNQDYNPGFKDKLLGGLSSQLFQVDHIIPLWAGGADTISNLQNLDLPTHQIKTNVQAVPLTLLANGKIDLNQARLMAMTWKDKDASNLPNIGDDGMYSVDFAEETARQWEDQMKKGKPVTFKDVWKGIPKAMQDFGKGWLPTPVREFVKQGVSGVTAGIVPAPYSEEAGIVSKITGTAGNIAGTIFGLGKFAKILNIGGKALLATKGTKIAGQAMQTAGLVSDIGMPISTFSKMRHSASLLSLWGQIGLTGQELTGQQEATLKNHMNRFLSDVAFGSLLGASGQTIRGYSQVGVGSTALSLIEGNDIQTALKDGALMTALHSLGYKGRFQEINEITYKRSAATLNQYLGEIVPTVKKGQGVPGVLKLDIPSIENMRLEYQKQYPNDPRISNIGQITGEYDAVDFLTRAALVKQGEILNNSIKKTDIPQEQIEAEIRRIGTAGVQLYNQTLSPEARIQKQIEDLRSIVEQLKPKITSEQLKQSAPSIDETFKNIPLTFPERVYEKPEGVTYPEGHLPLTGYASDIDPISKANIEALDKRTGGATSDRIILVSDPKTTSVMRLINFEAVARGEKPPIAEPEKTLRAYYIEETPEGRELKPVGYAATAERIGSREYNINLNYQKMIDRIKNTIVTAENPEALMERLNKDLSKPDVNLETAQTLFNQRQAIKSIEDANLLSMIKASSPLEKFDANLNNFLIAESMNKNGLSFVTGTVNKLTKTGTGEPFLVLSIKDQNWLESLAIRDKQRSPVQGAIKEITERKKAVDITTKIQEAKNIIKGPPFVAKTEVKPKKEVVSKGKETTYLKTEPLPKEKVVTEVNPPATKPVLGTESLQNAIKTLKNGNLPSIAKKAPTEVKMTQKEADRALYKRLSERVNQIVQKATDEGRTPNKTEGKDLITLDKKMSKLIKKNKLKETIETEPLTQEEILNKNAKIADEFFNDIVDRIESVKPNITSAQGNEKQLMSIIKGFERKNPGMSKNDFKEAMDTAKGKATAYAQDIIDTAWKGTKKFGTEEDYVRQRETEKIEKDNSSLVLAKKFGLKLQEPNEAGTRYLELSKDGNPIFSEEFKKENNIKKQTPLDLWGDFLGKEMKVYISNLSKVSKEWSQNLKEMEKSDSPYGQSMAKTFDLALKEKYGNWSSSWKANSALTNIRKYFKQFNQEGYSISQPFRRTIASSGKNLSENQRKIALADAKTKEISEKARIDRAERFSQQESDWQNKEFNKEDIESLGRSKLSEEDMRGIRAKDPNQIQNVSEDLTPFDIMTNGLLKTEVRNTLIDRYNNLRREMSKLSSYEVQEEYKRMKGVFEKIKEISKDNPESKTWKLGKRIILKNDGEPTAEEGFKDAQTILTKIFKDKPSPVYVKFDKIRENVLESINKIQKKPDGKGGISAEELNNQEMIKPSSNGNTIYFKQSEQKTDVNPVKEKETNNNLITSQDWNNRQFLKPSNGNTIYFKTPEKNSSNLSNFIQKMSPKKNTYDIRGLKINDNDLDEASKILYAEISNRFPERQQFEIRNIINTAINRAKINPQGFGDTLTKVLQKPYQYQGYAPNGMTISKGKIIESQYQKVKADKIDEYGKKKLQLIKNTLNEIKTGKFEDTTDGSMFYVHASDGSMWLGKTIKEAKLRANQHELENNKHQTQWGTAVGLPAGIITKR